MIGEKIKIDPNGERDYRKEDWPKRQSTPNMISQSERNLIIPSRSELNADCESAGNPLGSLVT